VEKGSEHATVNFVPVHIRCYYPAKEALKKKEAKND